MHLDVNEMSFIYGLYRIKSPSKIEFWLIQQKVKDSRDNPLVIFLFIKTIF